MEVKLRTMIGCGKLHVVRQRDMVRKYCPRAIRAFSAFPQKLDTRYYFLGIVNLKC